MIGGADWLGGENYIRNILFSLMAVPEAERPRVRLTSVLNANPDVVRSLSRLPFVEIHPLVRRAFLHRGWRALLSLVVRLTKIVTGRESDLEYGDVDLVFPQMQYNGVERRALYWIGDFQEIYLPEHFTPQQLASRHDKNSRIAESENFLVLSSRAALDDLNENFATINARVRIWKFCSFIDYEKRGRDPGAAFGLPRKFAYVANQFWAHKNHEAVFRAIGLLKARGLRIPLVCTGSSSDHRVANHYERMMSLLPQLGISDQVHLLGIVPREDQVELMRCAAFVVQPSFFEGWSTVVEDATALGRPIVVSDLKVHREQNPREALFFDPHDIEDLAAKIEEAWARFGAGPNPESEHEAEQRGKRRCLEAGRALISIFAEAAEGMSSSE